MKNKPNRCIKAASIVEMCAGIVIMIPVIFALLDVIYVSLYKTEVDSLAKRCAICAATTNYSTTTPSATDYQTAAQSILNTYTSSSVVPGTLQVSVAFINNTSTSTTSNPISSTSPNPQATTDGIITIVTASFKLPVAVPLGGPSTVQLSAQASCPLVNDLPSTTTTTTTTTYNDLIPSPVAIVRINQ